MNRPRFGAVMDFVRPRLLAWVARRYVFQASGGMLDLSDVSMLPESVLWPLRRDGLDPIAELGHRRREEPVSKLPVPLGINAWLVTGYEEIRQIFADPNGDHDWGISAEVDLVASDAEGRAVVKVTDVGQL